MCKLKFKYDPLKLKGSIKIPFTVEEIEESGEKYVTKKKLNI